MIESIVLAERGAEPRPGPTVIAFVAHARAVPSRERELFADRLAAMEPNPGCVVVRTCHRVEVFVTPATVDPGRLPEPPAGTVVLEDADAVRHLIAVACGLDSVVIGEDQILHQVRETLATRQAHGPLEPVLDRLFQVALRAGRQAHGWFAGHPRSLGDAALDRLDHLAGSLQGRSVLIVGAGAMGRLAAQGAARRGVAVAVANRTAAAADTLAGEVGGRAVAFGADGSLDGVAGVIVAIRGEWQVGPADRQRLADGGIAVVDLSSPPAVGPDVQALLGTRHCSVDDLAGIPGAAPPDRLRARLERLVSESGRGYCSWLRSRETAPAIHTVAEAAERHRQAELAWLRHRLPGVSPNDWSAVEQMSHRLVAALLHAPLSALRADENGDLERAARELFAL